MAAVYSAEEGSLQKTGVEMSSEIQADEVQEPCTNSESSERVFSLESAAVEPGVEASEAQEHEAEDDVVTEITIKEEEPEEHGYITVRWNVAAEYSEELTSRNANLPALTLQASTKGDWLYRCQDCSETFKDKDVYLEHRREHTHDGPIVCLDTDSQWDDLLVSTDGGRRTLCCALCGRIFSNSRGFFTHQLKHRSKRLKQQSVSATDQSLEKEKCFECKDCGKKFTILGHYLNHQRTHKQPTKSVLHQAAHLKKKSFQCPTCGRSYSRSSALDAHMRCHEIKLVKSRSSETSKVQPTNEVSEANEVPAQTEHKPEAGSEQMDESDKKLFECTCGKSFRTHCGLSTHQRFSTSCTDAKGKVVTNSEAKRTFDCSECGKSFPSPLALSCHKHWHKRRARFLGQKYKCKECGRTFTSPTFYNKHQRLAHSKETAAKSFLNQVVQLQKKAFECPDCGVRFSRASALQSHQLCHTDVFSEVMEKRHRTNPVSQTPSLFQSEQVKANHFSIGGIVYSHIARETDVSEKELNFDAGDGAQDYETTGHGFDVVDITESDDSGSDCESLQDLKLVCESDQEEKDFSLNLSKESEAVPPQPVSPEAVSLQPASPQPVSPEAVSLQPVSPQPMSHEAVSPQAVSPQAVSHEAVSPQPVSQAVSPQPVNPEMNVKIVHFGYENLKEGNENTEMATSPSHGAKKYDCPLCDRTFIKALSLRCHMSWHKGRMGKKTKYQRGSGITPIRRVKCEICGHESFSKAAHYFHLGKHEERKPYKSITYQLANLQKNGFKCEICGLHFSRRSALHSHQQHHKASKKPYVCLQCNKTYSNPNRLHSHQKVCCGKDDDEEKAENFNPTKKLLGPKVYHCKKCGKGFWSIGAYFHHKQYQHQCENASIGSPEASSQPESGQVRRKRRGRKRGIVNRKTGGMGDPTVTKEQKEHVCEVCGKSYRMLGCFLKHQLLHNTSIPPPSKSFDHQVEQLKKNSYSCPDCGKLFSRAMALQFHMKCHGFETGLPIDSSQNTSDVTQCQTCLAFFNCESLQSHQKHCIKPNTGSEEMLEEGQTNKLQTLNVVQENDANLQKQKSKTEREKSEKPLKMLPEDSKYECGVCGRGFVSAGALSFHSRAHIFTSTKPAWQNAAGDKPRPQSEKFPFSCSECGRRFTSNGALGTHRRWHKDKRMARWFSKNDKILRKGTGDGSFLCNLCGRTFFYLCVFRRHQKYHPPVEGRPAVPPKCKTIEPDDASTKRSIDFPDNEESALDSHLASVSNAPEDAKNLSLDEPIRSSTLDLPGEERKLKTRYHCTYCRKAFSNLRGLCAHKWQKHRKIRGRPPAKAVGVTVGDPVGKPVRDTVRTNVGDSVRTTVGNTARATLRGTKPLSCFGCHKPYSSLGALFNHEKSCRAYITGQETPTPPAKPRVVQGPSSSHHSVEPTTKYFYKCKKCGKAFPSEAQLDVHKEAARTRPHSCALCCRGFWTESQLKQHLAWHDEVRKRLPTELRYRLNNTSPQSGPSARHSGVNSAPPVKIPNSQSCKKEALLSPHALDQHQAVPKRERPYRCSLCPQTFDEIKDLVDHHQECLGDKELRDPSLSAHARGNKGLTCIECGTSFNQETDLHQHYIDHARGAF